MENILYNELRARGYTVFAGKTYKGEICLELRLMLFIVALAIIEFRLFLHCEILE